MARFTAMVDMANTPEDVKVAPSVVTSDAKPSVPVYPYGLCICLEEDALEKLGLDKEEMPGVGEMIHVMGMAKVTSVSSSEREMADGSKKECRRIELQITHLATEDEDREGVAAAQESMASDEARRKRFYGTPEAA